MLLTSLTACANSPTGKSLEQTLAADPRLKADSAIITGSQPQTEAIAALPADFPKEIPIYPNAQLQEVTQPNTQTTGENDADAQSQVTRWKSSDPSNLIANFYQQEFQSNNWEIITQQNSESTQLERTITARQQNLQVTVSVQPQTSPSPNNTPLTDQTNTEQIGLATEFLIEYNRNNSITAAPNEPRVNIQPGDPDFIGPVQPSTGMARDTVTTDQTTTTVNSNSFTDLNKAPQELRQYIDDLAALGVLSIEPTSSKTNQSSTTNFFEPSKPVSRREYARWLVSTNNKFHANNPAQQVRLASPTAQPVFRDVPPRDPDFTLIQGLAEAGLVPSPLSGDATAVLFRPNAALTREQMLLWKVPLDLRQTLPNASIDAVKQTWGFQDAARIEPKALRAVLADHQNSEQSNIRRVFGYTTLFQPKKAVTRAEAAAALWFFGSSNEGLSAQEALKLES